MKAYYGLLLALILALAACAPPAVQEAPPPSDEVVEIVLMTHDSFAMSEEVKAEFEREDNVTLNILRAGDAGSALNQAILSREAPLADVFFGVDNTFLTRALEAGIFEPYPAAKELANIPEELKLDPDFNVLPVSYGDVCLNYDKAWFAENDVPLPEGLEDLTRPEYRGLLVAENPATSSPGLAFLLATIGHFGEEGAWEFWRALRENEVTVVEGWSQAYYEQFTRYGGEHPLVVSYASSPPAEVYFADEPLEEAPTGSIIADGACFRQIEFVGILRGTKHRDQARALVDFMLSQRFQEDIPLQMFVFPANRKAQLPEVFEKYAELAEKPATVRPDSIAANRERWIEQWTEIVLR